MSLSIVQRKKLHAAIFGYLVGVGAEPGGGGGAFAETAEVFGREAALTDEDKELVAEGALEIKWKTKRQLEVDLMKVKEWAKSQVPCLPPLLGDEEVDDGHASSGEDESTHSDHNGAAGPATTVAADAAAADAVVAATAAAGAPGPAAGVGLVVDTAVAGGLGVEAAAAVTEAERGVHCLQEGDPNSTAAASGPGEVVGAIPEAAAAAA
ncbi:unnamed protein product, partial [Laminaria digitata]